MLPRFLYEYFLTLFGLVGVQYHAHGDTIGSFIFWSTWGLFGFGYILDIIFFPFYYMEWKIAKYVRVVYAVLHCLIWRFLAIQFLSSHVEMMFLSLVLTRQISILAMAIPFFLYFTNGVYVHFGYEFILIVLCANLFFDDPIKWRGLPFILNKMCMCMSLVAFLYVCATNPYILRTMFYEFVASLKMYKL